MEPNEFEQDLYPEPDPEPVFDCGDGWCNCPQCKYHDSLEAQSHE